MKKYIKRWLQQHPATCVNQHLRHLLVHYISTLPESAMPDLSELVLDITALMELVDALEKDKYYVK